MKLIALPIFIFLLGCCEYSRAQIPAAPVPVVEIKSIRDVVFDNWIQADGVFRIKWPCLKLTLRSSEDVKGGDILNRAYFYDKDRKLLSRVERLPNANHEDGSYGVPPLIKARTNVDVLLPIETAVKDAKWRMVVLVVGDKRKLSVETYPRRSPLDWKQYDFPERDLLLAQIKDAEEAKKQHTNLPPRRTPSNP